jgi:lysophospholipase L1-like esterase
MARYVEHIPNTVVKCLGGKNSVTMFRAIFQSIALHMYAVILLHVGTNDVQSFTLSKSQVALELLIAHVRSIAPQAKIIVSTILPRPKDFTKTDAHVKALNQWMIRELPRLFSGIIVLKSFTSFLQKRQPIQKLFYQDGLHLGAEGIQVLKQRFECVIERVRGNTVFLPTVRTLVGPSKLVRQMDEGITEVRTVISHIDTPFIVQGQHNP